MPTDFPNLSGNPGAIVRSRDCASSNVGLIVVVIMGALLLVLPVVGVPLIVIMVIKMRKKGKQRTYDVPPTDGSSSG